MLVTLPQRLGEKWHSFKVIRFHLGKNNFGTETRQGELLEKIKIT